MKNHSRVLSRNGSSCKNKKKSEKLNALKLLVKCDNNSDIRVMISTMAFELSQETDTEVNPTMVGRFNNGPVLMKHVFFCRLSSRIFLVTS